MFFILFYKLHRDCRSLTQNAVNFKLRPVNLGNMLNYCKSETGTARCLASALVNTEETLKYTFVIFFLNADTRVAY